MPAKAHNISNQRRESCGNVVAIRGSCRVGIQLPVTIREAAAIAGVGERGHESPRSITYHDSSFISLLEGLVSESKPPASPGLSELPVSLLLTVLVDR